MNTSIELTEISVLASRFVNHTRKNIFLTGKAGTGKTTFLKHIVEHTHKKTVIAAPTGIAAINAGGVTLHSLFQLPFGAFVPYNQPASTQNQYVKINDPISVIKNLQMNDNKRKLLQELELLIIDEVSMLRADLLDAIDVVLKHIRRKSYLPFGGVQVLFIGDLLQLPPVVKNEEWALMKEYYDSPFFFDARVLKNEKPVYIELDKIYRQGDETFISLLNNLRNNNIDEGDVELLNKYYKPDFRSSSEQGYITLTTHNYKAVNLNKELLQNLEGKTYRFDAGVEDEFSEYAYPLERTLELKVGAQVMFVKNDPTGGQRFFNGKIGVVSKLSDELIEVQFSDGSQAISVEKYKWENVKFVLNDTTNEIEEKVTGTFTQYPIKLAWAITVHKSQGLTFDKAIIDIGDAFAAGQVYVALSRLRSLDGLVLTSPVNYNSLGLDKKVEEFSKTKEEQQDPNEMVKAETLDFLRGFLLQNFDLGQLVQYMEEHMASYTKDEKRSAKQKHHGWALEIKNKIEEIKAPADKFMHHITRIIDAKEEGYLDRTAQRIQDANDYFFPSLKNISKEIFSKIEKVRAEKKIKKYIEELVDLEVHVYEQIKRMNKTLDLCRSVSSETELIRKGQSVTSYQKEREESLNALFSISAKDRVEEPAEKITKSSSKAKEKKIKIDTKEETFKLYKKGKTIEDIAQLRDIARSTVEGHLAIYIAKGKLDVNELVPVDKIEKVIATAKELDSFNAGPIKQSLGDDFSYGEIRMAIASYLARE